MTFTMRPRVYMNLVSPPFEITDPGDWIEITTWVQNVDFAHGRSNGAADFQPGSGRMTLNNRDGRFDPSNTDGPYYPDLKLRRRVRVDAWIENNGTPFAAYVISYGYIEQLPQTWSWRELVHTEVTWTDALGLLSNHDLPDSVWDYAIRQHCDAGRVVAWHRWDDSNSIALDSSGNGNHGRYVVSDAGQDPVTLGTPAPLPVIKEGQVDSIIPQVARPSLSVGKMVAETGQPAAVSPAGWRFPSIACHEATALWGTEFSVECWMLYRSAFSLDGAGGASALTPRPQFVAFWGDPLSEAAGFGVGQTVSSGNVQPYLSTSAWDVSGTYAYLISTLNVFDAVELPDTQADDGAPHHLVWRVTPDIGPPDYWRTEFFFDGVEIGNILIDQDYISDVIARRPMEIARQFVHADGGNDGGFASTLADVVVYNEALTDQQIEDNYSAGYWGRLTGSGEVTSGVAFDQALEMAGWEQIVVSDTGDKYVAAGKIEGRAVSDFVREIARSEDGIAFQLRAGAVVFRDEGWQRDPLLGGTVGFSLTDGSPSGLTTPVVYYMGCDFNYDDQLLANSWDVDWDGGTAHVEDSDSIAEHGRYEQSLSTLLVASGNAEDLAAFRTWQYSQPQFQVGEVTFDALSGGDAHIQAVAEFCEVGNRVRLVRTRPNGSTIDDEYHVMAVRHRIEPGNAQWEVTLGLELADEPGTPFLIGTSLIGGDDVLWY